MRRNLPAPHDGRGGLPFSRRALVAGTGLGIASLVRGAATPVVAAAGIADDAGAAVGSALGATASAIASPRAVPSGFSSFGPTNAYARPTSLSVPVQPVATATVFPTIERRGSGHMTLITPTPQLTYVPGANDAGLAWGGSGGWPDRNRHHVVIPLDGQGDWFRATWSRVGTYAGRAIGVRMTVDSVTGVEAYNTPWSQLPWLRDLYQNLWGTRRFFVLNRVFCPEGREETVANSCHWICGIAGCRVTFEFFYSDDASRSPINLDWAYFTCRSIQKDAQGNEWATGADCWQGHAFVPDGITDSLCYWANAAGRRVVMTSSDEVSDRTAVSFDFTGTKISFWRGDTVGWDGFGWSFEPLGTFGRIALTKRSANASISGQSGAYSLAGAVFDVFYDRNLTQRVGSLTTAADGSATLSAANGSGQLMRGYTYYVKERTAPENYQLNSTVFTLTLGASGTPSVTVPETPLTTTVIYYADGKEVYRETVAIGIKHSPSSTATQRAERDGCDPGIEGWYRETPPADHGDMPDRYTTSTTTSTTLKLYTRNYVSVRTHVVHDGRATDLGTLVLAYGSSLDPSSNATVKGFLSKAASAIGAPAGSVVDAWWTSMACTGSKAGRMTLTRDVDLYCKPRTAQVRYYRDDETGPFRTETAFVGAAYAASDEATRQATRPGCTPGFDGWYRSRPGSDYSASRPARYQTAAMPDGGLSLYCRNWARLAFGTTSDSDDLTGTFRTAPRDDAPLAGPFAPEPRTIAYGASVALSLPAVRYRDMEAGDTLKWATYRAEGYYAAEDGSGATSTRTSIERDTTLYVRWVRAVSDGVESGLS